MPSILWYQRRPRSRFIWVLNLVINGMPSILSIIFWIVVVVFGFKPCYKWNAFNTLDFNKNIDFMAS